MHGVSEEEFIAGNNVCKEPKCKFRGHALEEAFHCTECNKMVHRNKKHEHL